MTKRIELAKIFEMAQSNITLSKFAGGDHENWHNFETLLRSTVVVADVPNARRPGFLKLHLEGPALQFFQTLDAAVQGHFENAITALRNHYCNPQLVELHKIKFENLKFDIKTTTPEDYLVKVLTVASQAYPQPAAAVIAPVGAAPGDQARFDTETRDELERQWNATSERERLVKRHFIKSMPNWIKIKLLDQPEAATVQDLCTLARKRLIVNELCPTDDYTRDAFSELQHSDKLENALIKLTETQTSLQTQISSLSQDLTEKMCALENKYDTKTANYNNPGASRWERQQWQSTGGNYKPNTMYHTPKYGNPPSVRVPPNSSRYGQYYGTTYRTPRPATYTYPSNTGTTYYDPQGNPRFHLPVINSAQIICNVCGYPNHLARNCTFKSTPNRNAQIPFPTNNQLRHPKN